jgi:hypothetical protein
MLCLNDFLGVNIKSITRYLSEVNVSLTTYWLFQEPHHS